VPVCFLPVASSNSFTYSFTCFAPLRLARSLLGFSSFTSHVFGLYASQRFPLGNVNCWHEKERRNEKGRNKCETLTLGLADAHGGERAACAWWARHQFPRRAIPSPVRH